MTQYTEVFILFPVLARSRGKPNILGLETLGSEFRPCKRKWKGPLLTEKQLQKQLSF